MKTSLIRCCEMQNDYVLQVALKTHLIGFKAPLDLLLLIALCIFEYCFEKTVFLQSTLNSDWNEYYFDSVGIWFSFEQLLNRLHTWIEYKCT